MVLTLTPDLTSCMEADGRNALGCTSMLNRRPCPRISLMQANEPGCVVLSLTPDLTSCTAADGRDALGCMAFRFNRPESGPAQHMIISDPGTGRSRRCGFHEQTWDIGAGVGHSKGRGSHKHEEQEVWESGAGVETRDSRNRCGRTGGEEASSERGLSLRILKTLFT